MELPLKTTWQLQLATVVCGWWPCHACVKLLLHELHWLPVFFQGQFKVPELSAIKPYIAHGQLFEGPPSSWSFCQPGKSCQGKCTSSPLNQTMLSFETQEECLFCHNAWQIQMIQMISTLMTFRKSLKTWLFYEALGCSERSPLLKMFDICVDVSCPGCHCEPVWVALELNSTSIFFLKW